MKLSWEPIKPLVNQETDYSRFFVTPRDAIQIPRTKVEPEDYYKLTDTTNSNYVTSNTVNKEGVTTSNNSHIDKSWLYAKDIPDYNYPNDIVSVGQWHRPLFVNKYKDLEDTITKEALSNGIDPNLLLAMGNIESHFNPEATSGSYKGIFQINSKKHTNWQDPIVNTRAAIDLIKENSKFHSRHFKDRDYSPGLTYLYYQQGAGATKAFLNNPDKNVVDTLASVLSGDPIQARKEAIKRIKGNGGNIHGTSKEFTDLWSSRMEALHIAYRSANKHKISEWAKYLNVPIEDTQSSGSPYSFKNIKDQHNLAKLQGLDTRLLAFADDWAGILRENGINFKITEGLRNKERQRNLFFGGKSKTLNSKHLTGRAFDYMLYDEKGYPTWDNRYYRKAYDLVKEKGLLNRHKIRWLGDMPGLMDMVHWELM